MQPRQPTVTESASGSKTEVWDVPPDEAVLRDILERVFRRHWPSIVFGPLIQGAAYEFRCPREPKSISLLDGYLTVHFGGTHFHLCIGENKGSERNPTPDDLRRHRRPSRAEFFRGLDRDGAPLTWGFRMFNGQGEQQITIFFPSPFLTDDDRIAEAPDWSRLAVWEDMAKTFLGRDPDPADRTGRGFRRG
ncbi:MAG: hypothetical protein EA405_13255 [Rhodospirillales bacterium]|nr:MAG: hypothetical protein EA405_13255 [Rhodospirillales bacterium]